LTRHERERSQRSTKGRIYSADRAILTFRGKIGESRESQESQESWESRESRESRQGFSALEGSWRLDNERKIGREGSSGSSLRQVKGQMRQRRF
jgi:hypothetical protein